MKERETSAITISRKTDAWRPIEFPSGPIPLTADCVRRFTLMREDCVVLEFTLAVPFCFELGDRYTDELFGDFYLTKEQMPQYDEATGGYRYSLQMDREYMGWAGHVFMLTAAVDGARVRKEASWTLTKKLEDHMDEFIYNLQVLGYEGYSYQIESSCAQATEAHSLTYAGQDMLAALNALADSFETEWWVEHATDGNKIIHLGKCETATDPVLFSLDTNVEAMDIKDNRNSYANRIYIYGSRDNLPLNYRKALRATVTDILQRPNTREERVITDKAFTPGMFQAYQPEEYDFGPLQERVDQDGGALYFIGSKMVEIKEERDYEVSIPSIIVSAMRVKTAVASVGQTCNQQVLISLIYGSQENNLINWSQSTKVQSKGVADFPQLNITPLVTMVSLVKANYLLRIQIKLTPPSGGSALISLSDPSITMQPIVIAAQSPRSGMVRVAEINGQAPEDETYVVVNYDGEERWKNGDPNPFYNSLTFVDSDGEQIATAPVDEGDVLTLDSNSTLVPTAFYSTEYDDPTALARIGELRLLLPVDIAPESYLQKNDSETDCHRIVEAVVVFDKIYPDGKLKVSNVIVENKTDYTKYEGEIESSAWQWQEYTFAVTQKDGKEFPFRREYILPNETLRVRFLGPSDIGESEEEYAGQCLLAGMTFDLQFNSGQGTYTIVRNEDFGALLPNNLLYPQDGDPCVLIGWNTRSITDMNLVEEAEQRLLAKGREYMAALEDSQFTFTCRMNSLFAFSLDPQRFMTVTGEPVDMLPADPLYVRRKAQEYTLLQEGQPVTVHHGAMPADKQSRVIGYTLKLDKPYDNPTYVVGETEAYSHLAQLEKEITKLQ